MEGDAGSGPLTQTGAADAPSRLSSRRWFAGLTVVLVLLAGAMTAGGYLALRYHRESQQIDRDNAVAVATAKECVLATQAPASDDLIAAEQKIIDCATGEFRTQATLYGGVLVQAYKAAKVQVDVAEMRAAVERNNPDGSVDVLVAFRVKVDNVEAQGRELSYRLRAQLARDGGQYRIAKLDQVAR